MQPMQWMQDAVEKLMGEYPQGSGVLQREGPLDRETLLMAIDRFLNNFNNPDFKVQLVAAARKRQSPEDAIEVMQKRVFEELGVQGDYGVKFLGVVRYHYSQDAEVAVRFCELVSRENMLLTEVEDALEGLCCRETEPTTATSVGHILPSGTKQRPTAKDKQEYQAALYSRLVQLQSHKKGCAHHQEGQHQHQQHQQDNSNALSPQEQLAFFKEHFADGVDVVTANP